MGLQDPGPRLSPGQSGDRHAGEAGRPGGARLLLVQPAAVQPGGGGGRGGLQQQDQLVPGRRDLSGRAAAGPPALRGPPGEMSQHSVCLRAGELLLVSGETGNAHTAYLTP